MAIAIGGALVTARPASADTSVAPSGGSFVIKGSGFGHGWGMSQYGAYGAARRGLSWQQIMRFYYPGTKLTKMPTGTRIKVWVTADSDGTLRVLPSAGLRVHDGQGGSYAVPSGSSYRSWRISRSGSGYRLVYRTSGGRDVTRSTGLSGSGTWYFSTSADMVRVVMPSGSVRRYRGTVALVRRGSSGRTVNNVRLEDYVKGVVASEMPTSWAAEAVQAQTVAARSYAVRLRDFTNYSGYDICDTTACQVYGGVNRETDAGNAAVAATNGMIVTYKGQVALTQFASSNGGHTAQGDYPYLAPKADPYDGVVKSQAWTRTISASSIGRAWSVGTVQRLQITSRDGAGAWGGRVRTIKIIGSKRTVSVSGSRFQYRFGMRSSLYMVRGSRTGGSAPPPAPAPVPEPEPTPEPTPIKPGKAYATFPRSYSDRSKTDLLVISRSGDLVRYPVASGGLGTPTTIASKVGNYSFVLNAGDWDGDGFQDVIVRTSSQLYLKRGTSTGRLAPGVPMGFGSNIAAMAALGDTNGDKFPDLAVITTAGNLWLYLGDGETGRKARVKISSGWQEHSWLRGVGDFDRDGRLDIVTRQGDELLLHRGRESGFAAPITLATGWSGVSSVTAVGDLDGDHKVDIVARSKSGTLVIYRGNGKDAVMPAGTLSSGFSGTRFAI